MTSGIALFAIGVAGATYLGMWLCASHIAAHTAIMREWNDAQDADKKPGFFAKAGQFLKSFFYSAGVRSFNAQQIVNGPNITSKSTFLDTLKGKTLSSEHEVNEWTLRGQTVSIIGMVLTAMVAFYFPPLGLPAIVIAIALVGILRMVAEHYAYHYLEPIRARVDGLGEMCEMIEEVKGFVRVAKGYLFKRFETKLEGLDREEPGAMLSSDLSRRYMERPMPKQKSMPERPFYQSLGDWFTA